VGSNQVLSATFTPTDPVDYTGGSVSTTITVRQPPATIALGGLDQTYTGQPLAVTVTTNPANLSVSITYNGSATEPTYPGTYAVVATITNPNYAGTISGSMVIGTTGLVNHAPVLNGNAAFEGSIQMLSTETVNMSANSYISGDLLVPGTPTLQTSGNARVAGTINAGGTAAPTNYYVTLSGDALLRYLVRRINPLPMPSVAAPPSSSTNVTLNSNAPPTTLAAGNYGSVIVNSNTILILGVAGATAPSVYNIQDLILNGNGTLEVVGPVTITVGGSMALNGNCGASAHPEWLVLAVANGGVTLNSRVTFYGSIIAPKGQVIVDSNSTLNGTVTCNSLLLNGGAIADPNNP
jgi:rhamnogalacturonan endolyase